MITVGYIKEENGIHYFYSIVDDTISVQTFSGGEGMMRRKLVELKASSILILFEKFLIKDREIVDRGKDVHVYKEKIKRIQKYMEWGHENISTSPGLVIDNGLIMTKAMKSMIKMISDEHPMKKDLIFLQASVTQTAKAPYNV